jgi:hypothetical protein
MSQPASPQSHHDSILWALPFTQLEWELTPLAVQDYIKHQNQQIAHLQTQLAQFQSQIEQLQHHVDGVLPTGMLDFLFCIHYIRHLISIDILALDGGGHHDVSTA